MDLKSITGQTIIANWPEIVNYNDQAFKNYLDTFYNEGAGAIIAPVNTTGRVKAANGEFVNAVVDNLTVKNQFTNLYDNNTTADYNFYKTYIDPYAVGRDACTASTWWPYENPTYKFIDVNKPYYKLANDGSTYVFNNNNLSQVVGILFPPTDSSGQNYNVVMESSTGAPVLFTVDASQADFSYIEFICTGYDASWGPKWSLYKYGLESGAGEGGSGGAVGPGTLNRIAKFTSSTTIGDSAIYTDASGVKIDASIFQFNKEIKAAYSPALPDSMKMPAAVGGLPINTSVGYLRGKTFEELFTELLFPSVPPTLTSPSATFGMSPTTTLYEVSANIVSLAFTTTFNQGTIYNGATYQNVRSGLPNNYDYTGSNLVDVSSSSLSNAQSFGYDVAFGNQSWSCIIGYDAGPQPLDNKGINSGSPLAAGNVSATPTRTIEGAYPLYATTVDISVLTKQTLVSMSATPAPSSAGMLLVLESGGYKQSFEVANARGPLVSIETYNTVSSNWEYELGSAPLSLTRWTSSATTEIIQGYSTPYTKYTYNGPGRAAATIRLNF